MAEKRNPVDVHVGKRLRLRRALMGMSQERLGEQLGLTFQQIQKYERGANRIGASRLYEISRILRVPVSWFFEDMPAGAAAHRSESAPGLAEEPAAFVHDAAGAEAALEPPVVDRRETLELVRAFNRITDPRVRRRLLELAKALGNIGYATGPDAGGAA